MIELLTANTPNGKKVSIMLEEIKFNYKVTKVNINKDEQFKTEFIDERLSVSDYLAGKDYSIADIATFPWIARHEWHDIGLKNYKFLTKWYQVISSREAVKKGYDLLDKGETIPKV